MTLLGKNYLSKLFFVESSLFCLPIPQATLLKTKNKNICVQTYWRPIKSDKRYVYKGLGKIGFELRIAQFLKSIKRLGSGERSLVLGSHSKDMEENTQEKKDEVPAGKKTIEELQQQVILDF